MLPNPDLASATPKEGRLRQARTWLGYSLIAAICVGVPVGGVLYKRERWRAFVKEHDCKKVGHVAGDVVTSVGMDARGMPVVSAGVTDDKTAWKCNDGVTYWR